ncbi:MAG: secondary thiamine-phosphate synthase enzyme YjbQ [Candidatus Nanopusillus sp.]
MDIYQKEIKIKTKSPYDFIDITDMVNEVLKESGIKNGILSLFSLHNTACIIIQESDETIFKDIEEFFNRILPLHIKYYHNYEGNINATAHIKTNLLSKSLCISIKDGKLLLGT